MKILKVVSLVALIVALALAAVGFGLMSTDNETLAEVRNAEYYLRLADNYYNDNEYQPALISYEKALTYNEGNFQALHGIARCNYELGNTEFAVDTYDSLVQQEPDDIELHIEWIKAQIAAKKYPEAREAMERFIKNHNSPKLDKLYEDMYVEVPKSDLPSGTYDSYQVLSLETTDNANVVYTLDGSEPTVDSDVVEGNLVISHPNTTIKAKSINNLGFESETIELNYTITVPVEQVLKNNNSSTANAIRLELNRNNSQIIYNYEVAQITSLYVIGSGTEDLHNGVFYYKDSYESMSSGETFNSRGTPDMGLLKYTPFLETLVISWQNNCSLKQITDLHYLENLSLINNRITDVKDLAGCTTLKRLALGWNSIKDVSALAQLEKLESLGLWNNQITNIDALSVLTNLRYLDIANNWVSDISAVAHLTELEEFWANGNEITSIKSLDPQGKLKVLMISNNPLEDMDVWKEEHPNLKRCDWDGE